VERRAPGADDLLAEVSRNLSAASVRSGPTTLAGLRGRLHSPSRDDDTCTLAVRVLP